MKQRDMDLGNIFRKMKRAYRRKAAKRDKARVYGDPSDRSPNLSTRNLLAAARMGVCSEGGN